ncbi:MAG: protein jag [Acidimicrobiales bacterium]|nr:Jag N-terminal domain-containing protein [Acidimicrobiales bacterium]|tara:strand:+ start:1771 stop:2577 length:807 start_codon:yes stop_codon:yes gene_type:complete
MEWVEVRAENIAAAEELALDQLGVAREDAEFEVVTREENRLFGLKKTEARVRARVKPVDIPSKNGSNQRNRRKKNGKSSNNKATEQKNNQPKKQQNKPKKTTNKPKKDIENREPMPQEEQEKAVVEFLEGIVKSFDIDATVSIRMEEERIIGSIDGSDIGLLIGPKAGTLLALQDITRTVVQRHAAGRKTNRLSIDVGGYRERRKASLIAFTEKQAATVKETGKPLPLEPMGAADRKIIHDAASNIDGISSSSDGEEPRRRVVLQPSA